MSGPGDRRVRLGITLGDPAGIGPEVAVKALRDPVVSRIADFVLFGDRSVLERTAGFSEIADRVIEEGAAGPDGSRAGREREVGAEEAKRTKPGPIVLCDLASDASSQFPIGEVSAACGLASFNAIFRSVRYALEGAIDGVVTAPICKESLHTAGLRYLGHTEMLAAISGVPSVEMMFVHDKMMVSLVTRHVPLAEALRGLTAERVCETIVASAEILVDLDRRASDGRYRIGVAGLNPHAGEGGLFGGEEAEIVEPGIRLAREALARRDGGASTGAVGAPDVEIVGPLSPDTIFHQAYARSRYGMVVSLYHDQGLIPFKLIAFDTGVQLTYGLPFVRTSVDHGTAFDIAGKGVAKHDSMVAAIELGVRLVRSRRAKASASAGATEAAKTV